MHRTQLLLEQWQYEALRVRAERRSISLSELVREILTEHLQPAKKKPSGLYKIEGIGSDGASSAREHDAFLYGKPGKRR
jgi:hypothetical protein